jgi:hypothetical protein
MTGDLPGASRIVHQVMPERMAQTMDPFLAKLSSLNAAQKAAAVHLGEMPSTVRVASAQPIPQPSSPPTFYAPTPTPTPAPSGRRGAGASQLLASPPPPTATRVKAPTPTPTPTPAPTRAAQTGQSAAVPATERGDLDAIMRDIRAAADKKEAPRVAQAASRTAPTPSPRAAVKKEEPAKTKAKAETDEDCKPAPRKGKGKAAKTVCEPTTKAAKQAAAKKKAEPKNPPRIWVQVAGGANEDALPKEWARVTAKDATLRGKGPWTSKNRATNRLLAGPYKTDEEAQAVVRKLRKAGIGAFQWHSDAGEAVEKIGGK